MRITCNLDLFVLPSSPAPALFPAVKWRLVGSFWKIKNIFSKKKTNSPWVNSRKSLFRWNSSEKSKILDFCARIGHSWKTWAGWRRQPMRFENLRETTQVGKNGSIRSRNLLENVFFTIFLWKQKPNSLARALLYIFIWKIQMGA